jgi:hypothetical protein
LSRSPWLRNHLAQRIPEHATTIASRSNGLVQASTSEVFFIRVRSESECFLDTHLELTPLKRKKILICVHLVRHTTFLGSQPSPHQPPSIPGPTPCQYEFHVAATGYADCIYVGSSALSSYLGYTIHSPHNLHFTQFTHLIGLTVLRTTNSFRCCSVVAAGLTTHL